MPAVQRLNAARTRRKDAALMMDEKTFQQLDINQRDALSCDDFRPWRKGQGISNRDAQEIFKMVDRDGDGLVTYKDWSPPVRTPRLLLRSNRELKAAEEQL
jgi:EF-hand domain pair